MLLTDLELDKITIEDCVYSLKSNLFVQKPHFTTRKKLNKETEIEFYKDLCHVTKSRAFLKFCETITYNGNSDSLDSHDEFGNTVLELLNFTTLPGIDLQESKRIDTKVFLMNRPISIKFNLELKIQKSSYLLPANSTFIACDVKNLGKFRLAKFDIVYMDPPWQNKSVQRGSKYAMLEF